MSAGIKSETITLRESFDLFIQRNKFMNGSEKTSSGITPMVFIFKRFLFTVGCSYSRAKGKPSLIQCHRNGRNFCELAFFEEIPVAKCSPRAAFQLCA